VQTSFENTHIKCSVEIGKTVENTTENIHTQFSQFQHRHNSSGRVNHLGM